MKPSDNVDYKKRLNIENILMKLWAEMFLSIPKNYDEIIEYVYNDVCECADINDWNSNDILIGFRRWIESIELSDNEFDSRKLKHIDEKLMSCYNSVGMDKPLNHDQIALFILNRSEMTDIEEIDCLYVGKALSLWISKNTR